MALYVRDSQNGKLGDGIDATYASIDDTCPKSCALRDAGCYAQQWRVNATQKRAALGRGAWYAARAEASAIRRAGRTNPIRLHVSGDARTNGAAKLLARAIAPGRKAWTYTHAWRDVSRRSWGRVSVLASVESPHDAVLAIAKGYAVAMVVRHFPDNSGKAYEMPGLPSGVKALPCPAMTRDVDCASCRLCWNDSKLRATGRVIAFAAHGGAAEKARRTLPVVR